MFWYSAGIEAFCSGRRCIPFIAYMSSPLGSSAACMDAYPAPDPSSRGSIIIWLTGEPNGAPVKCQFNRQICKFGNYLDALLATLVVARCAWACWAGIAGRLVSLQIETTLPRPSLKARPASRNSRRLVADLVLLGCGQLQRLLPVAFGYVSVPVKHEPHFDTTADTNSPMSHANMTRNQAIMQQSCGQHLQRARKGMAHTFPRRFFSRLYWQTYSSSIQREHGACPLHRVRMRWQ